MEHIEYLHIPKCAGTFVKKLLYLNNSNDSDLSCKLYREIHDGDCSALHIHFFKYKNKNKNFFAIIRNPYTRFVSNYYYDYKTWEKLFGKQIWRRLFKRKRIKGLYDHRLGYPAIC